MTATPYDFSQTSMPELASIVAEHLHEQGITVVLVGGLAVEIYTDNLYLTRDIDMVNTSLQSAKRLAGAMQLLGFSKHGRVYQHPSTDVVVEFPSAPLSVGDELIKDISYTQIGERRLPILKVDDVIKDRLAAYLHWRDNSSLVQAVMMMLKHDFRPADMQAFCLREGSESQFNLLINFYGKALQQNPTAMADLEPVLTQVLFDQL